MSEDPYKTLGVGKTASQDEIQKAYRKLAKKLHPDLNPGDKQAEEKFKRISVAYNLLGDEEKRGRYDRGEIDETGAERPQQHRFYREYADTDAAHPYSSAAGFEDFGDSGDLFSELFGRSARGRTRTIRLKGADIRYHLKVDFLDAVRGARRRVTMPDGASLDISIPAGVRDGQILRLKGKGMPGMNGGEAGDALIEIEVAPHPVFERRGADIHIDLPITLDEAVLGGKVDVPTVTGSVTMKVPKGASSGKTLRLRGKGAPHGKGKGDQFVHLQVVLPPRIDPDLESFMKSWREKHGYDPRASLKRAAQ